MILDNELLPTAAEVINGAIMSGQPVLVVEGVTDISTYRHIASLADKHVLVKPVELIRGYGEGCSQVVKLIDDLEKNEVTANAIIGNLIGIIDKDVRDYRGELPGSNNIVVLKFYSIESHFVCPDAIVPCLKLAIPSLNDLDLLVLRDELFLRFIDSSLTLRLASLDALRKSIDPSYSPDFLYSDGFGRLNDSNLTARLHAKQADLLSFSINQGLDNSLVAMKGFVKGKVFLDALASSILINLKSLHGNCGVPPVPHCGYCEGGLKHKCELRINPALNEKVLRTVILSNFPSTELSYLATEITSKIK